MYAISPDRARQHGFVSYYNHTGSSVTDQHANNLTFTDEQFWWLLVNPFSLQAHLGGWGGLGFDVAALPSLLPSLLWAVALFGLRLFCQRWGERLGLRLGLGTPATTHKSPQNGHSAAAVTVNKKQRNRLRKFHGQVWLTIVYTLSAIFGYMVQRDKPWFGFPVNEANRISFLTPHPYHPDLMLLLYYQYGLGFYISECFALFAEYDIKRMDFLVYLIHHFVTISLIVFSHCGYEHRVGAYVLFIHDASDIMLSASKALHYVVKAAQASKGVAVAGGKKQNGTKATEARSSFLYRLIFNNITVEICFLAFVALFVFFRIICLPYLALANLVLSVKIRMCTLNYWLLVFLLHIVLQGMHVYWLALIVKLAVRRIMGGLLSDIRSEDEEEEDEVHCD